MRRILLASIAAFLAGTIIALACQPVSLGTPINSTLPIITGTPQVGATLTASEGTWMNVGSSTVYTFQWNYAETTPQTKIASATSSTYAPLAADVGHSISVTVTATNPNAPAGVVTSACL